MGVEYWLVDKDEEIKFYLGKIGSKDLFLSYVEDMRQIKNKLNSEEFYDIREKTYNREFEFGDTKLKDTTINHLLFFIKCMNFIEDIPIFDRVWGPILYFIEVIEYQNHEWDFVSDHEPERLEKYEDFKELYNPYDYE